ncbi:GNAT family N-acetyltransferase [Bacillus infantis]|uniref:GNAT family N-acetyltransferase n=1 Tax=Bacillus infantis TaxID=324767 RepID=UPI002155A230|nr:GNAT family N-acetyltransferase [Bacillus infantis]MCR6613144.1 GNAT family N-acetyltransferase [Bacillus infantis]
MNITLAATDASKKEIVRNLYSFYLHDLSQYSPSLMPNGQGTFEFDSFDAIWDTPGISVHLIKHGEEIAGFLLFLEKPFLKKTDFCINDLFLFHPYRGKGTAEEALDVLFQKNKGTYYVEQLAENKRAVSFWKKVFSTNGFPYEEREKTEDGDLCLGQFFTVGA